MRRLPELDDKRKILKDGDTMGTFGILCMSFQDVSGRGQIRVGGCEEGRVAEVYARRVVTMLGHMQGDCV
jgi:hypothetical protein